MAKKVLFLYNNPIAPEAMLGEAFSECRFDVQTFEVVSAARAADPRSLPNLGGVDTVDKHEVPIVNCSPHSTVSRSSSLSAQAD